MKRILSLFFLLGIIACSYAQGNYKYGAVNKNGDPIVPMIYDRIDSFKNGFAKATRKGKTGVIDLSGKEVIPCTYDVVKDLEDGMAVVSNGSRLGVVNTANDTIIDFKQIAITNYYKGTFLVYDNNRRFGVVDMTGKTTVPFSNCIGVAYSGGNGYIIITRPDRGEQLIIDRYNRTIYSAAGCEIRDMNDGYLGIREKTLSDKAALYMSLKKPDPFVSYKIVDIGGSVITPSLTIGQNQFFKGGFSRISENGKVGVVDILGRVRIPCIYDRVYDLKDGYAKVGQDTCSHGLNKYGVVDDRGNLIIPCVYDGLSDFKEGLTIALLDRKFGFLNQSGQVVIGFDYDFAKSFENGYAIVAKANRYGVIDKNGRVVIPLVYDHLKRLDNTLFMANKNLAWGIVNAKGDTQVSFTYSSMTVLPESDFVAVQRENRWGVINKNGEMVLPVKYNEIVSYSEGLFVVNFHQSAPNQGNPTTH